MVSTSRKRERENSQSKLNGPQSKDSPRPKSSVSLWTLQGSSTLRLHGTGGTGRIFERLTVSVQVWDLKKAGPKLAHFAVQIFVQFRRSRVNSRL